MTQWRTQGFWSKTWTYALLALLMILPGYSGETWLDESSSNRKRVFSSGFVTVCVIVVTSEVVVLQGLYGGGWS